MYAFHSSSLSRFCRLEIEMKSCTSVVCSTAFTLNLGAHTKTVTRWSVKIVINIGPCGHRGKKRISASYRIIYSNDARLTRVECGKLADFSPSISRNWNLTFSSRNDPTGNRRGGARRFCKKISNTTTLPTSISRILVRLLILNNCESESYYCIAICEPSCSSWPFSRIDYCIQGLT